MNNKPDQALKRLIELNNQKKNLQTVKIAARELAESYLMPERIKELYSIVYQGFLVQDLLIDELIENYQNIILVNNN